MHEVLHTSGSNVLGVSMNLPVRRAKNRLWASVSRRDVLGIIEMCLSKRQTHSEVPCHGLLNSENLRTAGKIIIINKFLY